jgi:predicted DNA-binding transcriptional regulator AlpA
MLCGGITSVSLSRWLKEDRFPKPDCIVGNRFFWQRRTVLAFIENLKQRAPAAMAEMKTRQLHTKAGIVKAGA